jgi:hypothetical protein
MSERTFTIRDVNGERVYRGFDANITTTTEHVVMIAVEGELDSYAIDDTSEALAEFKRYIIDDGFWDHTVILGVFKRQ